MVVELAHDRQACTCAGLQRLCAPQEELFIKFAEFEEKVKEVDRARAIYRYALDHIPREQVRSGTGLLCLTLPRVDDTQNRVLLGGALRCVSVLHTAAPHGPAHVALKTLMCP